LIVKELTQIPLNHLVSLRPECGRSSTLSLLGFLGLGVLLSELFELFVVLLELRMSLESDEELGLLCVTFNGDGLSLDLLEGGVVVPKARLH
jgi:hypothetical protein